MVKNRKFLPKMRRKSRAKFQNNTSDVYREFNSSSIHDKDDFIDKKDDIPVTAPSLQIPDLGTSGVCEEDREDSAYHVLDTIASCTGLSKRESIGMNQFSRTSILFDKLWIGERLDKPNQNKGEKNIRRVFVYETPVRTRKDLSNTSTSFCDKKGFTTPLHNVPSIKTRPLSFIPSPPPIPCLIQVSASRTKRSMYKMMSRKDRTYDSLNGDLTISQGDERDDVNKNQERKNNFLEELEKSTISQCCHYFRTPTRGDTY